MVRPSTTQQSTRASRDLAPPKQALPAPSRGAGQDILPQL